MRQNRPVFLTFDASGAAFAGATGNVTVIVDVIDMSTTLEAALDAGAFKVYGASPDTSTAPVILKPEAIGREAGLQAVKNKAGIILVSEPRTGREKEQLKRMTRLLAGIEKSNAQIEAVVPNLGAETVKLADFENRVVIAVTDAGGAAYDAAFSAGAPVVLTGTVARSRHKKRKEPALAAARRAIEAANLAGTGIGIVAASSNSMEDLLAGEYIMKTIIELGFTALRV